ncbi:hypothetical protein KJ877_10675 [bacterium]|nr:hypothetical protein [bacterium]MBU1990275.1 hypothetical protein [bacterium]
MKKIPLLLFILLSTLAANKADFSLIIDKPFNDALFDITQDYDRQISAVGYSKDFKESKYKNSTTYTNAFDYLEDAHNLHGAQIHLTKLNSAADITLSKIQNLPRFNEAVSVIKTPSNGYYIGGHSVDGSLMLLKLDSNANTLFTKEFGTKNYDTMHHLVALRDGGVLAVGTSNTTRDSSDKLFQTGLGLSDIYLSRFSKNGDMLWSKKYGTHNDDIGIDAAEAIDGSLVVLGSTKKNTDKNLTLMRITEDGDKIWTQEIQSDQAILPHKIIRLRDNSFLVSMSQTNEVEKEQIRFIKFDLQKNILLDKEIATAYASGLKDIEEFSDSSIFAVGYVQDTYNTDALVMHLDSNLNLLCQEHYGGENFDMLNALDILHDSKIAAAGIHTSPDSQESNMWIMKLNQDCSIAQKSIKSNTLYNQLLTLFKHEIETGKLSIREDLRIEFRAEDLYFNVAEYKLTSIQEKFLNIFSAKLLQFLKANESYVDTLEINGHTSSEWSGVNFTDNYLNNSKLSMNRAYATLSYIFKQQSMQTKIWLSSIIKGSGLSYSKKVMIDNKEDKEKSRRVSFKIILGEKL